MAIRWKFKLYLAQKHQLYTVSALQKRIVKKTGVIISVANLCKYVNRVPKMIRLDTMEILCSALDCDLHQFLSVTPKTMNAEKKRKLSFKNTPKKKIGVSAFPSPSDYEDSQLK